MGLYGQYGKNREYFHKKKCLRLFKVYVRELDISMIMILFTEI